MIEVEVHARKKRGKIEEKVFVFGPYDTIEYGYESLIGKTTVLFNSTEDIFDFTVGEDGACDSCAYDYPDMSMFKDNKSWTVTHFIIREGGKTND